MTTGEHEGFALSDLALRPSSEDAPGIFHVHRSVFSVTGEGPELRRRQIHPDCDLCHLRGSSTNLLCTVSEFQSGGTNLSESLYMPVVLC